MPTANVTVTESGAGFTIDVTAANLLPDLQILDFQVFHDGNLVASNLYEKTTPTLLTHVGASLPSTEITIRRKTPNNVVQTVNFADRVSSNLWNSELDRIIRWREEADLNGVGDLSFVESPVPIDDPFSAAWNGAISSSASRNAIYDKFVLVDGVGSTNATNIATNASNISTNTSNITSNDADIATNAANIATNASNIASNDSDISAIQSLNTVQDGRLTNAESNITSLQSQVTSNDGDISALQGLFTSGTWTPTIGVGTTPVGTISITNANWYRVGKLCMAVCNFSVTTPSTGGGNARIQGLPFNAARTGVAGGHITFDNSSNWTNVAQIVPYTSSSSATVQFYAKFSTNTDWSFRSYAASFPDPGSTGDVVSFSIIYETV